MKSSTVQMHRYGAVAMVTLCARPSPVSTAAGPAALTHVLDGMGAEVGSVILDLDCAPFPAPADALDVVDAWADGLAAGEDRWPVFVPLALAAGFSAAHSCPLQLRDQSIGALNLLARTPTPCSPEDARLLKALTSTPRRPC
ncbi:hypothetical protein [Streptomyces zaomyceticus]|uniref:hypothetical protein n=1 Tax=Streptomyces zaomyceticus TaxID=68286 RepID=UPI003448AD6F